MNLEAMEVINKLREELEQKSYDNILLKLQLEKLSKEVKEDEISEDIS